MQAALRGSRGEAGASSESSQSSRARIAFSSALGRHPLFRTRLCVNPVPCPWGAACGFAHGAGELLSRPRAARPRASPRPSSGGGALFLVSAPPPPRAPAPDSPPLAPLAQPHPPTPGASLVAAVLACVSGEFDVGVGGCALWTSPSSEEAAAGRPRGGSASSFLSLSDGSEAHRDRRGHGGSW